MCKGMQLPSPQEETTLLSETIDAFIERMEAGSGEVKQRTGMLKDLRELRAGVEASLVSMSKGVASLSAAYSKLFASLASERSALLAMKAELREVKAQFQASRRLGLLGQLAYTVDWAAEAAIQQDSRSRSFTTIENLVSRYERWGGAPLSVAERQRYVRFERFLKSKGFAMQDAVDLTRMVRGERIAIVHGAYDEQANTTAEQLASWASQLLQGVDSDDMQALIQLSALFAADASKPLSKKDIQRLREEVDAA